MDEGHVQHTVIFDDHTPDEVSGQMTEGEREPKGWGTHLISHSALHYDEFWNTEYLKNDCLEFRISQVVLSKTAEELPVQAREQQSRDTARIQQPPTPPVSIVMTNFISHKIQDFRWDSPAFYSHIGGYKMCLNVDTNGVRRGTGTHVSVGVCLLHGEYDDDLSWPFRGEITIRLVNQRTSKGHVEYIIPFDDETPIDIASRVTEGEREPRGWGYNFISHSALHYDEHRDTQYLKNDCLEFQITQVKLTLPVSPSK